MYAQFPASAIYRHNDKPISLSSEGVSSPVMTLLRLALDHQQNHFLLERLALKYGQVGNQVLIDISREILYLTTVLWTQRDHFQGKRYNLEWMVRLLLTVLLASETDISPRPCSMAPLLPEFSA